jgi:hypothetical protein
MMMEVGNAEFGLARAAEHHQGGTYVGGPRTDSSQHRSQHRGRRPVDLSYCPGFNCLGCVH